MNKTDYLISLEVQLDKVRNLLRNIEINFLNSPFYRDLLEIEDRLDYLIKKTKKDKNF
jgi:low affinity Fe/Cu permease